MICIVCDDLSSSGLQELFGMISLSLLHSLEVCFDMIIW